MLTKQGATQVVFDKDRGLELLVRALGGTYLPLRNGRATGFNPLQLEPTPANTEFLEGAGFVPCAVAADHLPREKAPTSNMPSRARWHSNLELDACRASSSFWTRPTRRACMRAWRPGAPARRAPTRGPSTTPRMPSRHSCRASSISGFDVTDFLDHAQLRTPITLYLFHLVRAAGGRSAICVLDG